MRFLIAAMMVLVATNVEAQDSHLTEIIDVWRTKSVEKHEMADQAGYESHLLQVTNRGASIGPLVTDFYTSPNPLSESQMTLAEAYRSTVNDSLGLTADVVDMFDEWGMLNEFGKPDIYSPMGEWMIQYATGPWQHESMLARANRLYNRGENFSSQARIQDQLNAMYLLMYDSALSAKASAVSEGLPEYYMYMYNMMISYSEDQLVVGYTSSFNKWSMAYESYFQSRANFYRINDYYDTLLRIYNRENNIQ